MNLGYSYVTIPQVLFIALNQPTFQSSNRADPGILYSGGTIYYLKLLFTKFINYKTPIYIKMNIFHVILIEYNKTSFFNKLIWFTYLIDIFKRKKK